MKHFIRLYALFLLAVLLSCSNNHLITDNSYRKTVYDDYKLRANNYGASCNDLFLLADSLNDNVTREAVSFLLAYVPLSDLAVYDDDYLLKNVNVALKSRAEMPWGKNVPVDLFLHFVLPPRVNNENPDNFRTEAYDQLKERVQGLSAMEAALEINHWCQERVSYQPADSRTSSPLATILSARGRCGEESTFTVSALRTAGIPARQVYTPRWAHTDDNHAWVEFWADGQWHYMGACEPEPVPDRGWFTEPARRAMLIHTRAFGRYGGTEPLVRKQQLFAEINTLNRYAVTKTLKVTVKDTSGHPVPKAKTGYMLYNYAEFYPLARLECDNSGETSLITGMGSLLIWADDGNQMGFTMVSPADTVAEVTISPEYPQGEYDLDISVPPALTPFPGIDETLANQNHLAVKRGDSIRNAYVSSWMKDIEPEKIAHDAGLPVEKILNILKKSMGNYHSISDFIKTSGSNASLAMHLLENISDKDLRDTPSEVLLDHIANAPSITPGTDPGTYYSYVLSPRISNELLSPFRSVLLNDIPADMLEHFVSDPASVSEWIDTAITITSTDNYYGTPIIPSGIMKTHTADIHSRDIFYVAVCRTAGIPSRLAPGTGRPQFFNDGKWTDVWFNGEIKPSGNPAHITFSYDKNKAEPEYYVSFTIARVQNGEFKTLDYEYGEKITNLPQNIALDPGIYMLTTGNRDDNGNVLASVSFLTLEPDEGKTIFVDIREIDESEKLKGDISLAGKLVSYSGDTVDLQSVSEKGIVFIWMEPGKEPTRHILNDFPRLKKEFDAWGGHFIFLTDPARTPDDFDPENLAGLPDNSIFVSDENLSYLSAVPGDNKSERLFPVVICCDSGGKILFSSEGYRIGTGETILKKIK